MSGLVAELLVDPVIIVKFGKNGGSSITLAIFSTVHIF
jgi:hypothetical protein